MGSWIFNSLLAPLKEPGALPDSEARMATARSCSSGRYSAEVMGRQPARRADASSGKSGRRSAMGAGGVVVFIKSGAGV